MPLHPQCKLILDLIAASMEKPLERMSAIEAPFPGRGVRKRPVALAGPAQPFVRVEDRVIGADGENRLADAARALREASDEV